MLFADACLLALNFLQKFGYDPDPERLGALARPTLDAIVAELDPETIGDGSLLDKQLAASGFKGKWTGGEIDLQESSSDESGDERGEQATVEEEDAVEKSRNDLESIKLSGEGSTCTLSEGSDDEEDSGDDALETHTTRVGGNNREKTRRGGHSHSKGKAKVKGNSNKDRTGRRGGQKSMF